MDFPVYIVPLREVCAEVPAPALLAAQRRPRDQARDGHEIAMAPALSGPRRRCCILRIESGDRLLEILARAKQTGTAPHQIANRLARHGGVRSGGRARPGLAG